MTDFLLGLSAGFLAGPFCWELIKRMWQEFKRK